MKPKNLGQLWKREEELNMIIKSYESELQDIRQQIAKITGTLNTHYDPIYDDENPDYIRGSEDGI